MFPIYGFSSPYFIEQCCWYNVKITSNNVASQIIYEWRTLTSTTIPHSKLKDKLRELVQLCFIKKNGQCGYKYLVLWKDRSCFVKKKTDSPKRFSETDIFKMLEFLIDNTFVMFGGHVPLYRWCPFTRAWNNGASDFWLTSTQQFFSYIMARTS